MAGVNVIDNSDPLWNEYVEAVNGLSRLPELLEARRSEATANQEATLTAARATRDTELRRCRDWQAQAKRAVANAEAKLVAAKVLIPDSTQAPNVPEAKAQQLIDQLRQAVRDFDDELALLDTAARRARERQLLEQRRVAEAESRQRQLRILMGILAVAVIALVVLILMW